MLRSSIARKAVVGVTGALLFLFVIFHMLGNLQVFLGRDSLNHYAELLHAVPELLWVARITLLTAVALHIGFSLALTRENRAARPKRYAVEGTVRATRASRTMAVSGLMVLAFIIYHLLHFTVQVTDPDYRDYYELDGRPVIVAEAEAERPEIDLEGHPLRLVRQDLDDAEPEAAPSKSESETESEKATETDTPTESETSATEIVPRSLIEARHHEGARRDVYRMVVTGFRSLPVSLVYILAQVLLGLHLSHGASAMFQTLGLTTPGHRSWLFRVGPIGAAVIVIGNISMPIAILLDDWTGFGFFDV